MSEAKVAFARRLNQAFDRLEIPPKQHGRFTQLARLFGVSAVAARSWCEGKSYPSVDKLLVIMDTARCGADWLLYGRSAPALPPPGASAVPPTQEAHAVGAGKKAVDSAAAASGSGRVMTAPLPSLAAVDGWLATQGDAMAPTLLPGDRVRLDRLDDEPPRDGIYALLPATAGHGDALAGGATPVMRRLLQRVDGSLESSCDNPLYRERAVFLYAGQGTLQAVTAGSPGARLVGRVAEINRRIG